MEGTFANNCGARSKLGYIILLADATGKCNTLSYRSFKGNCVTRAVLGAEAIAFSEAFDRPFVLKRDFELLFVRLVPLAMFTDFRSLFDSITNNSIKSERQLIIHRAAASQSYDQMEISEFGLVGSEFDAADVFTKVKKCTVLKMFLSIGAMHQPIW